MEERPDGQPAPQPARPRKFQKHRDLPDPFAVIATQCIGPQQDERRLRAHRPGFGMNVHTSSLASHARVSEVFLIIRPTMQRVGMAGYLSCSFKTATVYRSALYVEQIRPTDFSQPTGGGAGWRTYQACDPSPCLYKGLCRTATGSLPFLDGSSGRLKEPGRGESRPQPISIGDEDDHVLGKLDILHIWRMHLASYASLRAKSQSCNHGYIYCSWESIDTFPHVDRRI